MESSSDSLLTNLRDIRSIVKKLPSPVLDELLSHASVIKLHPGETLFEPEQPYKNAVFFLSKGKIELSEPGRKPFLVKPGHILGLNNYFDSMPYRSTAIAVKKTKFRVIPAEKLRELEQRYPELFNSVNRLLTERIRRQVSQRQPVTGVWSLPARTVMKSPLATCSPSVTVREAFMLMSQRGIGSLGVIDSAGQLLGMITLMSLAEGLITKGAEPDDFILDAVCEPAKLIEFDTPMWKVQGEQERLKAKYLIVKENGSPVGMISQTDILQTLLSYQRSITTEIGHAANFEELKAFTGRLGQIAEDLSAHNRNASQAVRALSEVHLAIQRRCIDLVLEELHTAGKGEPPFDFALIIMGSGGRKEMMISTDQDNGIILAETPDEQASAWFMDFCDRINHRLDDVGYEWCKGDIMARNPDFHNSIEEWRNKIIQIADMPTEKTARWSTIFFDFETLYGNDHLTVDLRTHLHHELKRKPRLLRLMVEDDASGSPAIGFFNRLVTSGDKERKGRIDLKRNGTRILADAARIYALSEGIDANNSGDRLRALVRQGRLGSAFTESVLAAYDELLDLTLAHQLRQLEKGEPLDKLIDLEELTQLEEEALRMAMRVIKRLQGRMQGEFGTVML